MQSIATAIGIRKICACRWMPSAFPDRSFAEPFGARTLAGAGYAPGGRAKSPIYGHLKIPHP